MAETSDQLPLRARGRAQVLYEGLDIVACATLQAVCPYMLRLGRTLRPDFHLHSTLLGAEPLLRVALMPELWFCTEQGAAAGNQLCCFELCRRLVCPVLWGHPADRLARFFVRSARHATMLGRPAGKLASTRLASTAGRLSDGGENSSSSTCGQVQGCTGGITACSDGACMLDAWWCSVVHKRSY